MILYNWDSELIFSNFIQNKIVTIRNELSEEPTSGTQSHSNEERITRAQPKEFRRVTEKVVDHDFDIASKQSCELDLVSS